MNKFGYILGIILLGVIVFILGACIFWGIGNLIIWVFKINYIWTFWHGLVCQFVFVLLKEIFGNKKEK